MGKTVYRELKMGDVDALVRFANELVAEDTFVLIDKKMTKKFEKKWVLGQLKRIRKRDAVTLLAESDGRIVGNCGIRRKMRGDVRCGRIGHSADFGISVSKDYRGHGVGETLARKTIALAKKRLGIRLLTLTHFANNKIAHGLYLKLGFRDCGKWPKALKFRGKYVDEVLMYKFV